MLYGQACLVKQVSAQLKTKYSIWASTRENPSLVFANKKGADHPAHARSLISTFFIHLLESILSNLLQAKFSFST